MKRLFLATRNAGKIRELKGLLAFFPGEIVTLADYNDADDVLEDGDSFLANALIKARHGSKLTGEVALADDSGLEVDFLGGAPGVQSAIFAGPGASDEMNMRKLLDLLAGQENRAASFVCVLVLHCPDGNYRAFEGRWKGFIAQEAKGENGFGYDPIFFVPELGKTAAEISPLEKGLYSHRAQAAKELIAFLKSSLITGRSAAW